ncbi:MAG TPA: hypothetical protein VFV71_07835 [Burkholderiales bacterium]|nr:hypothetical protein [Burkholderiales bacterium]
MKSFFESLLRLYEFDGPKSVTSTMKAKSGIEGRPLEVGRTDESTFPYLP